MMELFTLELCLQRGHKPVYIYATSPVATVRGKIKKYTTYVFRYD